MDSHARRDIVRLSMAIHGGFCVAFGVLAGVVGLIGSGGVVTVAVGLLPAACGAGLVWLRTRPSSNALWMETAGLALLSLPVLLLAGFVAGGVLAVGMAFGALTGIGLTSLAAGRLAPDRSF